LVKLDLMHPPQIHFHLSRYFWSTFWTVQLYNCKKLYSKCSSLLISSLNISLFCWWEGSSSCWVKRVFVLLNVSFVIVLPKHLKYSVFSGCFYCHITLKYYVYAIEITTS
jgi:hypothetical protein